MSVNDNTLEELFSKLCINTKEYSKVELLINNIKNDETIKNKDKIKFFNHIDNVFFQNMNKIKSKEKIETQVEIINKDINDIIKHKETCKKCEKNRFKKYNYCYKHCQEENIIPKEVKRKDFDNYIKK
jgi:hypothetical protein